MTTDSTEGRLMRTLASMLKVDPGSLSRESSRADNGAWDSLKHMHLMLALEEEFDVEFSDEELSTLSTAGALLEAIEGKLAAR